MSRMLAIKACKECPFFHQTLGSMLMSIRRPGDLFGMCFYDQGAGVMPPDQKATSGCLRVPDGNTVPPECPLQTADIILTLGD